MNIEQLAADLAARVPEMARDGRENNAALIANTIREAIKSESIWDLSARVMMHEIDMLRAERDHLLDDQRMRLEQYNRDQATIRRLEKIVNMPLTATP